jgi:hypothetical protein
VTDEARQRERIEEQLAKVGSSSRSFAARARAQAGVEVAELIDPDGEAVASLVDGEISAGAAALALPMDLITFETWLLGHLGDRDELDLDVNTHKELWFALGSWIAETMKDRHGGFWLIGGEDPRAWRVGFSKILLEIAPHVFAERLLRSGPGMAKRMLAEIDRIRQLHEEQAAAEGGKAKDKYQPQHYARLHTVPLAQWLVIEMAAIAPAWNEKPVSALRALVAESGKRLPPQNAPVVEKVGEMLAGLDADKPAAAQSTDRGLYEAVTQIVAMRRVTAPIAVDILEKVVLPALHLGIPDKFPPLGDDDLANLKKGIDLFALYVDVVPYAHEAEDGGFLGTFSPKELGTPYPDRNNLEVGKGDWLLVNPQRLRPMLAHLDAKKMIEKFDKFVEYVRQQPGVPRIADTGRGLAETAGRALLDLKAAVDAVGQGCALVFRLLPPPG